MSVIFVPKLWMDYLVDVSHFTKYGTNRLLIVWEFRKQRNANKCPKIAYSLVVKKTKKMIRNPRADRDHHEKSITSRGSPLAHACQLWSTSVSVSYPVFRITERTNNRKRSYNIRLTGGGNNNNNNNNNMLRPSDRVNIDRQDIFI